jgi:hypothetical protein
MMLRLLLYFVICANWFLSDLGYRIGHVFLAMLIAFVRYDDLITASRFLFFYLLSLELVAETIIFSRKRRRKFNDDGHEVIQMIKEELSKQHNK